MGSIRPLALFDDNECLRCGKPIDPREWTEIEPGLFIGQCHACGAWHHLWEYRDGVCVARPTEPQAAFEPSEPTPARPVKPAPQKAPQKPQRPKLKRGEVDPMQTPLFGSGEKK